MGYRRSNAGAYQPARVAGTNEELLVVGRSHDSSNTVNRRFLSEGFEAPSRDAFGSTSRQLNGPNSPARNGKAFSRTRVARP